ncbi:hypothetical protein CYQ91_20155 [Vibrio diabolicus]|uniref:Replication protein n=1 Tax=Vibrio diabolicus TaxID=50719 RepID=A0AAX1XI62_9VIBR|nr:hypothetical protein [Vibrio diabolicus]RPB35152.1 hypothetical protein CYQ91_20155 [Vibrio diabolicus]
MIKNWTVTTEPIKNGADGVMTTERYLLSERHSNHKQTEAIIPLIGTIKTSQRIALVGEQFRLNQHLNRKGGRPLSSYAMSFCLTLPKGHRPSALQWKCIIRDCCKAIEAQLELQPDEVKVFRTQVRAVLHQQRQQGTRGSGDHVHILIGKVLNGRVLKQLQQKKCTSILKQAFNAAVLTHTGLNHLDYKPYELNRGDRLETWKYREQKAAEAVHIEKLLIRLQKQTDKWFEAIESQNHRQQNRQLNRLIKSFEELSATALSDKQSQKIENLKAKIGPEKLKL